MTPPDPYDSFRTLTAREVPIKSKLPVFILTAVLLSVGIYAGKSSLFASPFPAERHFEFTYRAVLPEFPQGAHEIRIWIPVASSRDGQKILQRKITASVPYQIHQETTFGNEMLYAEVKAPEGGASPAAGPIEFKINYEAVVSKEIFSPKAEVFEVKKFLRPSRLMIVNEEVRERARVATSGKKSWREKARAIYDYVISHMSYDKNVPGWGRGDTARACLLGKGNCTDFHSLFISLAHAAEIPSRFKIGFAISPEGEGKIPGYHCWAEFYDEKRGWVPVDASEAWKRPERKRHYFGEFDTNKFLLTLGRDIPLVPSQAGDPVNIFIYPYLEGDGKPLAEGAIQTDFSFRDLKV